MPSAYIAPDEYEDFGISDASAGQVQAASTLVNNFLGRTEGLEFGVDANGAPAFMSGATPTLEEEGPAGGIPAGSNITISPPFGQYDLSLVGTIVVIDRANEAKCEACLISGVTRNSITLQTVQFAHAAGATLEYGMSICDELSLPVNRSTVMLTRTPVARIQAGYGRYGYGRRSGQYSGVDINSNLLAYTAAFGGPPMWTQFDATDVDLNRMTGTLWTPPGILLAYFSDVRISYIAGYKQGSVPYDIQQAVANLVSSALEMPVGPAAKMLKAGDATIQRFGPTALDDDTKAMLSTYRAKWMS